MRSRRPLIGALAALGVVVAGITLLWSVVATSSARFAATTSSSGFFSAAEVDLTTQDGGTDLRFDADGLYPGTVVEGCVEIEYIGTTPAELRLYGRTVGGTGLEKFVDFTVAVVDDGTCDNVTIGVRVRDDVGTSDAEGLGPDADPSGELGLSAALAITGGPESDLELPGRRLFLGRLSDLHQRYDSYARGLVVETTAQPGDTVVLRAAASLVDDNEAQGLTTDFFLTVEARP